VVRWGKSGIDIFSSKGIQHNKKIILYAFYISESYLINLMVIYLTTKAMGNPYVPLLF